MPGDMIFVVSGKVSGAQQYIIGGLEVSEKISALEAFDRFPDLRLHNDAEGYVVGNVVCDQTGSQHYLDHHIDFAKRVDDYIVGRNPINLIGDSVVSAARAQSLDFLKALLGKNAETPYGVMGRASRLNSTQTEEMVRWLRSIQRTQ